MPRKQTYFQQIAGIGYIFAIILAVLFFGVAWLSNKGRISLETAVSVIALYWISSAAYFIFGACSEFPKVYRFFLGRMRLYSRFTWVFGNSVCGTLFWSMPVLYFLFSGFSENISLSFNSYSIKLLMASYGSSLMLCVTILSLIVNVVAAKRGVWCFKRASDRVASQHLAYVKPTEP
jgi:hypothetical protein